MIRLAMARLYDALAALPFEARLVLSVHDELVVEISSTDPRETATVRAVMTDVMEETVRAEFRLSVTVPVTVEQGPSYGEMAAV